MTKQSPSDILRRRSPRPSRPRDDNEIGVYKKPWNNRVKIALVYPNFYRTGMSSLGFQLIYKLLNEKSFITCERVFLPEKTSKIVSLENGKRLSDFDFVLFSVSYSADFINVLDILKKSSIPLLREKRILHSGPILGAGGTGIYLNPETLASVFDFFHLGEAENFLDKFTNLLDENSKAVKNRDLFLNEIRHFKGIYLPEDIEVIHDRDNLVKSFHFKYPEIKIEKDYVKNLNSIQTHSALFSRNAEFGSIFLEEISRGCPRGCRFCAIGYIAKPFRVKNPADLGFIKEKPQYRVGLLGAGICDHPDIKKISHQILDQGQTLSYSSFRADRLDSAIGEIITRAGVKTFTIAPEAGSERLRKIIKKNISQDEIISACEILSKSSIRKIRLYFMIGLPYENSNDIDEISLLCAKIAKQLKKVHITASVNPFIPKPFTPFQWHGLKDIKYLKDTLKYVKKDLNGLGIKTEAGNIKIALIDSLFSKGSRIDGEKIVKLCEIDYNPGKKILDYAKNPGLYIHRTLSLNTKFPWDFIDIGISKNFLADEFKKAKSLV